MKMRTSSIITIFLLFVILIEGCVLLYDLLTPHRYNYKLATVEIDVPVHKFIVPPFLFEINSYAQTNDIISDISEELNNNLVTKISKIAEIISNKKHEEPEISETAPEDEEHLLDKILNQAVNLPEKTGKVMIAIVIDDMGVSIPHTNNIISLQKPMTASFLTYGAANKDKAEEAKQAGMEIMLHTPMMPHKPADLAPITLSSEMSSEEIQKELNKMLLRYDGAGLKGINNHMGSAFTEDEKGMNAVMQLLKDKNLYFLDSKTTSKSVAKKYAQQYGVPYISRDVFLDNKNDYTYIMKQLNKTEKIAQMRGYAVAICHPRSQTYNALKDWVKNLDEKQIELVHLSTLIKDLQKKL